MSQQLPGVLGGVLAFLILGMGTASKRWDSLDSNGLKASFPQSCLSVVENIKPDTLRMMMTVCR